MDSRHNDSKNFVTSKNIHYIVKKRIQVSKNNFFAFLFKKSEKRRETTENGLESPRGAFRPIDPGFSHWVVFEMPCLWIPFQRLVQPVGDAAKLADRDGACTDFDVCGGAAARTDAGSCC